jgi:hypothetical protein
MTTLGAWLRITQSFTFLPLGTAINRVPLECFQTRVVVKALRAFPQFESVALGRIFNILQILCDCIKGQDYNVFLERCSWQPLKRSHVSDFSQI